MAAQPLAFEALLDHRNEVRKQAEAAFHALREEQPALVVAQLISGLSQAL